VSAALPDPPPPAVRLPGDVRPARYALELTIAPDRERATGRVAIDAQVVRPTRVVWLNATGLAIERATLAGKPARVIAGGEDFIGLSIGAELPVGPLAVEVAFGAPIDRTKSRALYAEREGADWYAYTFFEPIDARRAFPCFDEPAYKVPWQLTFHVPAEHVALGNAPVVREVPERGGMKRVELAPSRQLPSYLVAFVVGPFELVDGGIAGRAKTPIRFVIPKGRAAELRYARQITPRVVTALEDYFDMAYPFHKLDVAVVPRYWGTMEHPGLVDLFAFVQQRHGARTEAALRSFVEQPGVPRIAAALECKVGAPPKLRLGQRRALPAGTLDPTPRLWQVPVCVRYGDTRKARRACTQLGGAAGELALEGSCPTWVIPNADATGYYRSVVDPAMARALLTQGSPAARAARPTPSEKMMLIADLGAMVQRDELPLDQLLELVPIVAADPDELFARWAFHAASFSADALADALYEQARRYYQRTFGPAARRLSWTRGKDDSDERHDLRRTLVPMIADRDAPLAKEAAALAERWLAERKGLDADLVGSALYVYASRGDRVRFDKLRAVSKTARDRAEQQRILSAIGGFRDPALVRQALELVRGTELDLRDSLGILYLVVFRRETRALGLAFVTANLDGLLARMRDDEAAWFMGALAGGFCVAEPRALMERLLGPRAGKYSGAVAAVTRGLEQSQQCIDNARRQLPAPRRFLARY
jgi:aminopeptidase N